MEEALSVAKRPIWLTIGLTKSSLVIMGLGLCQSISMRRTYEMLSESKGKVLFVASVYPHLAGFHKPFMRLLQDKGYEVHSAASFSSGRVKEIADLESVLGHLSVITYDPQNMEAYHRLRTCSVPIVSISYMCILYGCFHDKMASSKIAL